jgi:hypothetical protein
MLELLAQRCDTFSYVICLQIVFRVSLYGGKRTAKTLFLCLWARLFIIAHVVAAIRSATNQGTSCKLKLSKGPGGSTFDVNLVRSVPRNRSRANARARARVTSSHTH